MRIWLLLAIQAAAYAGLAAEHLIFGTLTHGQLPITLSLVGIAVIAYGLTIWQVEKEGGIPLSILWLGTILFRVLLLITLPTLSSDIYRYLWDGYVANNGVSPYAFPIESTQLDYLAHPVRAQANHTWMASPYLPAAQWLFGRVTAWLPISAFAMQLTMVLVDLLNGLLIMAILTLVGLPKYRALIYLWNPLVVVEIAQGAHIDGWMICLTMAAIWLFFKGSGLRPSTVSASSWERLSSGIAPIMLALATLTKILPAFLVALLFWQWRWWRLFLFGGVVAGFLLFAGTRAGWGLVGELDGHGLFGALRIYGDQWNYNSGIFHWIEVGLGPNGWVGWEMAGTNLGANQWAKRIVALLLLSVLGGLWLMARRITDNTSTDSPGKTIPGRRMLLRLMAVPFMAYVVLSATMHPWYLLLLLSFMPFLAPGKDEVTKRQRFQWLLLLPWLYLSGAIFLSYLTYLDPENLREYEWIRRTEWLPTLGLLLVAGVEWLRLQNSDEPFTIST